MTLNIMRSEAEFRRQQKELKKKRAVELKKQNPELPVRDIARILGLNYELVRNTIKAALVG